MANYVVNVAFTNIDDDDNGVLPHSSALEISVIGFVLLHVLSKSPFV